MHLLEVHLEQFRSFGSARLQLHQGVNVVIGRNGSGKSNLVEAVAFVLQGARCDPLTRRHLVHHGGAPGGGAGGQVVPRRGGAGMAATVRVVLDNTDRRLPVDQDVVEVRRTIGPVKEDALFLQDKRILREELQSLLESAGFSRFNPYYVVRQGQVAEMATCSDRRRLEVIRELTGIQGFDECRRDAEKKMAVVSEELEEVLERLKELDRHIEELREDDKDLKNFQKLDRERRAIDFILDERSKKHKAQSIKKLSADITKLRATVLEAKKDLSDRQEERKAHSRRKEEAVEAEKSSRTVREEIKVDLDFQAQRAAKLETQFDAYKEEIVQARKRAKEVTKDLEEVGAEIGETESALRAADEALHDAKRRCHGLELEKTAKEKLQESETGLRNGAVVDPSRFRSAEEMEEYVEVRRSEMEAALDRHKEKLAEVEAKKRDVESHRERCLDATAEAEGAMSELTAERESLVRAVSRAEREAAAADRDMNELARDRMRKAAEVGALTERFRSCEVKLQKIPSIRSRLTGIKSLRAAMEDFGEHKAKLEEGLLGVVADLLRVKGNRQGDLNIALSEELGNRLLSVVVKDARTATRLLGKVKQMKLPGEVYFMAADRLMLLRPTDRRQLPHGCKMLLDLIEDGEDPSVNKALEFLLGKSALVDGPDKFAALQAIGLNGVTLDGVQGKFKGDLRGGYLRGDQSILTLYEQMMAAESDLERAKEESAEAEARLESASRNRGRLTKEAQSGRTRLERAEAALAAARARRSAAEKDRAALHGRLRDAEDEAHRRRCDIKEAEGDLAALAAVVQGDTLLATQERTDLEAAVKALRRRHRAAFKDMNAKEAEAWRLRNLLQECLLKRREDAEEALSALGGSELEARASNTKEEMEDAKQLLATLQVEMASADTALTAAVKERRRSDKHEDTLVQAAEEAQSRHAEVAAALARKESRLASLRADVEGGAGGAGTVPHEEVERMQDWEDKRLFGRKKKLSKVLKKFKGVNSLATEEMRRQEEAKAKFSDRREKALSNNEAVRDLLEHIEAKRQSKIDFTYSQINKYFSEIFRDLVPDGEARMVFVSDQRHASSASASSASGDSGRRTEPVGVSLQVRFEGDEMLDDICHLSGGQKSIVALAFIFAVQRCDPAPFFVLDEVDAALDARHRRRVAQFVRRLSRSSSAAAAGGEGGGGGTQFLCTTFRRELLASADRFVAVSFMPGRRESRLSVVDGAAAADFISREEEAARIEAARATRAQKDRKRKRAGDKKGEEENEEEGENRSGDDEMESQD